MTFSQFRLEAGHLADAEIQARGALASGDKDNSEFHGSCMLVLGFVALYSGGVEESRYYLDAADQIFAGNASRFSLATASLLDGEIHYQRRLLHEALTAYDKSRRLLQDVGDQRSWAIVQLHRSRALISLGSLDLARKGVTSALEHLESVNNQRWASFGALIGARIEAEAQRWDLANSRLQTALSYDLRSPTHMIPFTEQLVAVARQWVFSGQYEVAEQILSQCSKKLELLGSSTYLYEVADEVEYLLHVVREPDNDE
jgi:ATP/maltotriose-dependent transcriptional regulator MalT